MYNGSGDYVIAFSSAEEVRISGGRMDTVPRLSTEAMSPLFQATLESVEEAIYNSLLKATTVVGQKGRRALNTSLGFSKKEKPIVAQIFGSNPENIKKASRLVRDLGFDGVDINMGCPDRKIEKQKAGASLIKDIPLARKIIRAAISGAEGLPVSVKTRIGYNKIEYEEWLAEILKEDIKVLTIHLRTRKEMSKVEAHWDLMPKIVKLRDKINPNILIIGNGDITSLTHAKKMAKDTGCDGVMIGRAIFGNPFLFNKKNLSSKKEVGVTTKEKLSILLEHTKLFEKLLGDKRSFSIMKKHFKAYVSGFDGAKELRQKLMEAQNSKDVRKIIKTNKL